MSRISAPSPTAARSNLKGENAEAEDIDIIGQFGVGFYSAFMVAEKVTVSTRSQADGSAWKWGVGRRGRIHHHPCDKDTPGTDIVLTLKPDAEEEHYSEFLDEYRIKGLVKKYSDYPLPHPHGGHSFPQKEGSPDDKPEFESYKELETSTA